MSTRQKSSGRPSLNGVQRAFSSMSVGSYARPKASVGSYGGTYSGPPITAVAINKSLLAPLNLEIDPNIQRVRQQEKDQIKGLNNKFANFIDKVRFLEQQNTMLDTKWKLLQNQQADASNIEPLFRSYIANLQAQLNQVERDRERLDSENHNMHRNVEDFKTKYEEEINKRNGSENEFVMLKKDVDSGYLSRVDLEDRVAALADEINFLKSLYDEELRELAASMQDTSVVVQMNNSRGLNMEQVINDTKAQYEFVAARSKDEAEGWYKTKFDQMTAQADQYGNELRNTKNEIAEINRLIAKLQNDIATVKGQRSNLKSQVSEAEEHGERATKDAQDRIRDLEAAMQRAKQDMARQVREYQELMNIKLALDIEISTYRKLLEGEEDRLGQQSVVNIHQIPNHMAQSYYTNRMPTQMKEEPQRKNNVIIKMVETSNSSTTNYN